jgi:O-antigen/teichoic acid export membrane protein
MLRYGFPLLIGSIIIGFAQQFRGFLLSWFITSELIGNFSVANWFLTLITVFSTSISNNLLPAFSKLNWSNEPEKAEEMFRGSVRYSTMFLLPIIFLLISISEPIVLVIFGDKYPQAPVLLSLRLIFFLFIGLGSQSIFVFLNSQGNTKTSMRINILTSVLMIFLMYIFIQQWSVYGLIFAHTLSVLVRNLLGIFVLKKMFGFSPNLRHSYKTFISCVLSGGLALLFKRFFSSGPMIDLILCTGIFLSTYLIIAPIIGAIRIWDLKKINSMFKNFRIIYPITRIPLKIMETVILITSRGHKE